MSSAVSSTEKRIKTSKRNYILALVLLLITNILMGFTLMTLSNITLREQINERLLDVANTAAYQLDGDTLKTLTAEDKGTEKYEKALEILRAFQYNIELDYIYGIRPEPDGSFTFTIDPDPVSPGDFGSPIEGTVALKSAAAGQPAIDKVPHSDQWGRFYTAYSPVYDSDGKVAGIVGVDFNADLYDAKVNSNRIVAIVLTAVAMVVGIILSAFIMAQNRKRFDSLLKSIYILDDEIIKLDNVILQTSIKKLEMLPESESEVLKTLASGEAGKKPTKDEYDEINTSIDEVYRKLNKYLKYLDSEVYLDPVTGVQNKAAYKNKIGELDERVQAGYAEFSVVFLDINGIKNIYTHFGFEAGDKLMFICAKALNTVFGKENVYHITGDEFIVLMDARTDEQMKEYFRKFDEELKRYNDEDEHNNRISVARGYACFDFEKHRNYRDVFIEAEAACQRNKAEHYAANKPRVQF